MFNQKEQTIRVDYLSMLYGPLLTELSPSDAYSLWSDLNSEFAIYVECGPTVLPHQTVPLKLQRWRPMYRKLSFST